MESNSKLGKYVLTYSPKDYSIIVCKDKLFPPRYSLDDYVYTLYDFTVDLDGDAATHQDNAHDALDFVSHISRRFLYYEYYVTIAEDMENRFRT